MRLIKRPNNSMEPPGPLGLAGWLVSMRLDCLARIPGRDKAKLQALRLGDQEGSQIRGAGQPAGSEPHSWSVKPEFSGTTVLA